MPLADFLVVGMKTGTGIGTGNIIGNGAREEYIVIGAGMNSGIGTGIKFLRGCQLSSVDRKARNNLEGSPWLVLKKTFLVTQLSQRRNIV